jgi:hypothetical protein
MVRKSLSMKVLLIQNKGQFMKILFFFIIFNLLQTSFFFGQHSVDEGFIKPGVGISPFVIGASLSDIEESLGDPTQVVSFDEEKTKWEESGFDTKKNLPFFIGFDKVIVYDDPKDKTPVPIWKFFLKNDRVVYMIFSSFGYDINDVKKYYVKQGCNMGGSGDDVEKIFSFKFYYVLDNNEHENYYLFADGALIIVTEKTTTVFHIFAPLDSSREMEFRKLLNNQ